MAASDFIVRFDDFSGGDYGVIDPAKANNNTFSGQNVMLYESGLVGVRPGFKMLPYTGLPTSTVVPGPVGFDVYGENLIVVVGDSPYRIPLDGTGTAVAMGTYPDPATTFVRFTQFDNTLYSLMDGKLYKHNGDATVNISLPGGITLSTLTRWGYYLIGSQAEIPWRLYYSKVSEAGPEPDVWDSNAYVDIGGSSTITVLTPMFNQLMVGKPDGWWSLTGVLAERPAVRGVEIGNGPLDSRFTTMTTDNRVLYWAVEALPHWFNGTGVWLDSAYRVRGYDNSFPCDSVIATPTGRRLFMLGAANDPQTNDTLLIQDDRKWTAHSLPNKLAGLAPSDLRHGYNVPGGVVFGVIKSDNIGVPVNIVSFQHDIERPAHTDDEWASPTDVGASNMVPGVLLTPAWYDPQGRQVMVRNVQIQFRKWPSGIDDGLNEIHCAVRPLARWQSGTINTEPQMWTEPSSRADPSGTDDSWTMNFGAQGTALGFQIELTKIRGVAIREINVGCEVVTRRG